MTFDECIENIVADSGDARYHVSTLIQEVLDKVYSEVDRLGALKYDRYAHVSINKFNPYEILSFIEFVKQEYSDNS